MYFQNCEILDINRIEDKFLKEILDVYSYVIENSQKIELELKLVKDFEVEFRKYSPKDLKLRPSTEKLILNLTNVLPVYNSSKLLCLINEKYFNYLKGININPVMSIELDLIKYVTRLNLVNKIVIESNTLPKVFTESFVKGLVNALIDLLIESCYVKELENTYNIKYIVEPISIMYNNMIIANVKLKDDMVYEISNYFKDKGFENTISNYLPKIFDNLIDYLINFKGFDLPKMSVIEISRGIEKFSENEFILSITNDYKPIFVKLNEGYVLKLKIESVS